MALGTNAWLYFLMMVCLISGTAHTLLMKLVVGTEVPKGPYKKATPFEHPVLLSCFMFFGCTCCLFTYYLQRRTPEEIRAAGSYPKIIMGIPALCDLLASSLVHASYVFIPASMVQMFRSANLLFVFILSIVWLKKRQYAFHIVGVLLVVVGIVLVALAGCLMLDADEKEHAHAYIGVPICLGSQVFHAVQNVVEDKLLHEYSIPPQQAVGIEGVVGSLIAIVILLIMNPLHGEDTIGALYQMHHSAAITISVIFGIVCTGLFNWSGMTITKHSDAIVRTTIDSARTPVVWILELAMQWASFEPLQLVGCILIGLGTLLYNRIFEVRRVFYYPEPGEETQLRAATRKKDSDVAAS